MKLDNKIGYLRNQYRCDLTRELDLLTSLSYSKHYNFFYHYILADDCCKNKRCLDIMVPSGTVGHIFINSSNKILGIIINTNGVVKTYPSNINELVKKFIGEVIEF